MQKLKGKVTISKIHAGDDKYMEISFADAASGIEFLEARMSLEEFAEAITNLGMRPCEISLRGLENLGKKIEIKHETIDITALDKLSINYDHRDMYANDFIRPFETDGWSATDPREIFNHHRITYHKDGKRTANVSFRRYV